MEQHSELLGLVHQYATSQPSAARPSKKRTFAEISSTSDPHDGSIPHNSTGNYPFSNGYSQTDPMMCGKRRKLNYEDRDQVMIEIPRSDDLGQFILRSRQNSKDKPVPFKNLVKKETSKNRQMVQDGTESKSKYVFNNPDANKTTVEPIKVHNDLEY